MANQIINGVQHEYSAYVSVELTITALKILILCKA